MILFNALCRNQIKQQSLVRFIVLGLTLLLGSGLWACSASAAFGESAHTDSLLAALSPKLPVYFCDEEVPLDSSQQVKERFEKEMLLILWDRPQVLLWLKRSHKYFPEIEKQLSKAGMPEDLKYLPIVESALRPHAGSSKGAIGFWQLLPETARKYGLTVNGNVDQRRAIVPSTRGALAYLKKLHKQFDSWTLAAAGYNMGEERLSAEILEQDTQNYYQLYLPLETQQFVFRIVVIKLILSNPKNYGFSLKASDYYPPLQYDTITLDAFDELPLRLVAKAAKADFKTIKDLNPDLRGYYISAGTRKILLPKGMSKGFLKRFRVLTKKYTKDVKSRIYIVQPGDNLTIIAEKHNVPLASLLIWNKLNLNNPIHPGDHLVIHPPK
ncbi:MAG: transglycosylase SLT domain-containing protein [Desulfobacteraceae bacterium]|jgi:hypothetical protein